MINGSLLEAIDKWKTHTKIVKATSADEIKYLVVKFVNDHSQSYNYAKPAEFHTAADEGKADEGQSLPNTLKPLKSLGEWAV